MTSPKELISRAPHFDVKIAEEWLESTRQRCQDEVEIQGKYTGQTDFDQRVDQALQWEIRMLGGFSHSDMGVLYVEHQGGFSSFGTSAGDIVRKKFGLASSDVSLGDIERNRALEPIARKKFIRQMEEKGLVPFDEAKKKVYSFIDDGGDPEHPWLTGYPKGVFKDKKGDVWLVKFSVPRTHESCVNTYNFPSISDQAQMAHLKLLLERSGVTVNHTVLCPLSIKTMECMPAEITISKDLEADVLLAGDNYWEMVLNKETPSFTSKNAFENIAADSLPEAIQKQIFRFAFLKKIEGMAKKQGDMIKSTISGCLMESGVDLDVPGKKTRIPLVDIRNQKKEIFNQSAAKEYIEELGGDPTSPRLFSTSYSRVIEVARGKSSPYASDIERVSEIASRVMLDGEIDIAEEIGFDDLHQSNNVIDPRDESSDQDNDSIFNSLGQGTPSF